MKKEDTVKLISAEGFEFIIDRKAALVSNTLRNMLTSSGIPELLSPIFPMLLLLCFGNAIRVSDLPLLPTCLVSYGL